jgi:hypothetical protein
MILQHRSKWVVSCLDNVSPLCSPQGHGSPQYQQAPRIPSPLQGRGTVSGPLVWVRVTKYGKPAPDNSNAGESYWWPAYVRPISASHRYRAVLMSHTGFRRAVNRWASHRSSIRGNLTPRAAEHSPRDVLSISCPPLQASRTGCYTLQPSDVSVPRRQSSAEISKNCHGRSLAFCRGSGTRG